MKKKVLIGIIIFLGIITIYNTKVQAMFKINDFEIDCELYENGDIYIEEKITYATDETKNGLIRTINTKNNMNTRNSADEFILEEVLVDGQIYNKTYYAEVGDDGVYTQKGTGSEYEIKVFSPFKEYTKTLTYKYKLSNVAVKYNDIAELYWNFIGDEWDCKIEQLKINITLPTQAQDSKIYVYGHGSDDGTFTRTGNYISLIANDISEYQAIDARILFSTNSIPYSEKTVNKNVLDKYIEREEGMVGEREEPKVFGGLSVNEIAFVLSLIIIVIGIIIYLKYDKEYKVEKYKYYREIPYDLEPEILQRIYYGKETKNAFWITFLNLVKKGVFRIEKTINEVGRETEKIVFVNYGVGLNGYQIEVRDIIRKFMRSGKNEITLLELQAEMKSSTSFNKYKKFKEKLKNEYEGLFGECKKAPKKIIMLLAVAMIILIGIMIVLSLKVSPNGEAFGIAMFFGMTTLIYSIFFATAGNVWPAMIFLIFHCGVFQAGNISMLVSSKIEIMYIPYILLFILIQYAVRVRKQSKEERTIREQIKGLRRFLKDYSLLSEKEEITQIALWENYFIIAIALGLNDKVINDWYEYGQIFMDSNIEKSLYNVGGYTHIQMTMRPMFNAYSMHSMISSSGGSGSSYSGSSGGFSGGSSSGGGGRRRWRRKFLLKFIKINNEKYNYNMEVDNE